MDGIIRSPKPKWVLWLSLAFLLWNLFGAAAFVMQWMMTPADLAKLPVEQQELWGNMAGWIWTAYAIAVGAGTTAALGLVLGKKWAVPLFLLSVVAIAVQFCQPLGFALEAGMMSLMIFPAFIFLFALVEWWLARKWRAAGWLN
jgi:hypothetical protein